MIWIFNEIKKKSSSAMTWVINLLDVTNLLDVEIVYYYQNTSSI